MTTQTMNNFETLDLETLANVEGGNRCKDLIFGGALTGAGAGFTGGMAAFGVTAFPGAHVGAVIGGCLGGMLMAWAAGPVSAGGYTMICATSGLVNAYT